MVSGIRYGWSRADAVITPYNRRTKCGDYAYLSQAPDWPPHRPMLECPPLIPPPTSP